MPWSTMRRASSGSYAVDVGGEATAERMGLLDGGAQVPGRVLRRFRVGTRRRPPTGGHDLDHICAQAADVADGLGQLFDGVGLAAEVMEVAARPRDGGPR